MLKGIGLGRVLSDDASAQALTTRQVRLLQQSETEVVRVELRLGGAHQTWDATILDLYKQAVDDLTGAHTRVIGILDPAIVARSNQNAWNLNNTENTPGVQPTNPFVDAYVHFMRSARSLISWVVASSKRGRSGTSPMPGAGTVAHSMAGKPTSIPLCIARC
jgi:hypothetical protein